MVTVLRAKSQITIPSAIVASLDLKEGDQLDIFEENGSIRIVPVAVYPKAYVDQLQNEIAQLKEQISGWKEP
ncbi:MAG: AbrB/MazE/SpoVT family DNA-binding domain-containing protein [Clostridia bacterium]|jgi:AbrB family looped-hinge helix DNA binding protein|nr:AbrB/MazE/SpoVT family DNA-binding domain-containing protein [Clostridia bacterium]